MNNPFWNPLLWGLHRLHSRWGFAGHLASGWATLPVCPAVSAIWRYSINVHSSMVEMVGVRVMVTNTGDPRGVGSAGNAGGEG